MSQWRTEPHLTRDNPAALTRLRCAKIAEQMEVLFGVETVIDGAPVIPAARGSVRPLPNYIDVFMVSMPCLVHQTFQTYKNRFWGQGQGQMLLIFNHFQRLPWDTFVPSYVDFWQVIFEILCGQTHTQTPPKQYQLTTGQLEPSCDSTANKALNVVNVARMWELAVG